MSYTAKISAHLANTFCYAAVFGGLGYLGARIVNQIDPRAALVCSATAGATTALFFNNKMNFLSKITGLGLLIYAPFKLCELLKLPISMQTCLIVTGITTAAALFIQNQQENYEYKQTLKKIDIDFEKKVVQMKDDFDAKVKAMKVAVTEKNEEMGKNTHDDLLKEIMAKVKKKG